jgi:hypothetical protein
MWRWHSTFEQEICQQNANMWLANEVAEINHPIPRFFIIRDLSIYRWVCDRYEDGRKNIC